MSAWRWVWTCARTKTANGVRMLKPLREALGWDIQTTADFLHIPLKAAENWDEARYSVPEQYVKLMQYRIKYGEMGK